VVENKPYVEDDRTLRMIAQRIEDFRARQNVEADEHDVVGQKHETRELVSDLAFPEDVVAKIADVSDLRVFLRLRGEWSTSFARQPVATLACVP